jgi:hypothetical protein
MTEAVEQSWKQATDLNGYHVVVMGCESGTSGATAKQFAGAIGQTVNVSGGLTMPG